MAGDDVAYRPHQRDRGDVERVAGGGRAVEELLRALLEGGEDRPARVTDVGHAGERLDEQQAPGVRFLLQRCREPAQGVAGRSRPVVVARQQQPLGQEPFGGSLVGGQQARFLAVELLVEGRTKTPARELT